MHYSFLTREQRGLTFVKKNMAVFSTFCHVLPYTAIFAFVYQMQHIFPALRGQCKKLKHGTFARLNPPPPPPPPPPPYSGDRMRG